MMMPGTHKTVVAVVALLCAVLLSACNGGAAGKSGPNPTATFGPAVKTRLAEDNRRPPTRTPTPLPSPTAVPPTVTPEPPVVREPAPEGSTEVLLAALLTVDEMPDGWGLHQTFTLDDWEFSWVGEEDTIFTPRMNDDCSSMRGNPYVDQATSIFNETDSQFLLTQSIALYASEERAERVLEEIFASLARCPEREIEYGGKVLIQYQPLEYPVLGDQSAAFLISSSAERAAAQLVAVVFRIDHTVSIVVHANPTGSAGSAETWGTQEIVLRAHEKLHSVRELIDTLKPPPAEVI